MAFSLTNEQAFAVDTLHVNCIVPAGAGSGKTRVLVERYLKIIEKHSATNSNILEQIVAITFTEKAAKEMMERVRKGMVDRRERAFNEKKMEEALVWRENIQRLERASISTIHSFCARVLREFPVEAKLDPEFIVLDAIEANWMLTDVTERELKKYLEKDAGGLEFYQWVSTVGFQNTISSLVNVYKKIANSGLRMAELERITMESFTENPYRFVQGFDQLINVIDDLFYAGPEKINKKYQEFQENWPKLKETILHKKENGKYITDEIEHLVNLTSGSHGSELKDLRGIANNAAKSFKVLMEAMELNTKEEPYAKSLVQVLKLIDKAYLKEKEQVNGLDFDELQNRTIQLLRDNQDVKDKLQQKILYLMVDEFQDNNQVQKELIDLLLRRKDLSIPQGSLFVVGDPKQSIYRFRGADVHVFKEMEQEIVNDSGRVAPLVYNFRSDPRIIDFVNHIFPYIMSSDEHSPNFYHEAIAMKEKEGEDHVIEFLPVYLSEEEKDYREIEAEMIARRIQEMLAEGTEAREITILFRSTTKVKIYENALANKKIPFYVVGGKGFYQKQEVQDLIHILQYVIDPTNKIALAGILRSPMIAITDDTLFKLMSKDLRGGFQKELFQATEEFSKEEISKLDHFYNWFMRIKQDIGRTKVAEILDNILDLTEYKAILLGFPQGLQAVANIEKFVRVARDFPGDNPYSIYEFLQRIHRLIDGDEKEQEAAIESETGNTVKLMTIHQSKGLEFPYVFIPDLAREPFYDKEQILFNSSIGLTCKLPQNDDLAAPLRFLFVSNKEKQLDREESVRIFYVAATRAEKKLILSSKIEEDAKEVEDILSLDTWSKWLDAILSYQSISIEEGKWSYSTKHGHIDNIKVSTYDIGDGFDHERNLVSKEFLLNSHTQKENDDFRDLTVPLTGDNNHIYTITALKRYQQCPRFYYYTDHLSLYNAIDWLSRERDGFEEDIEDESKESMENMSYLTPTVKGTLVHELLEQLTMFPSRMDDWQQILTQNMILNGLHDIVDTEAYGAFVGDVKVYVEHYKKSRFYKQIDDSTRIKAEYDFELQLTNGKLRGTIDRLEIDQDDYFTIIDYKTDKEIKPERYKTQIMTYALAILEHFKWSPKVGMLYYLRHNYIEEIPLDEKQLLEWKDELNQLIGKINTSSLMKDFEKSVNDCSNCVYNSLCNNN